MITNLHLLSHRHFYRSPEELGTDDKLRLHLEKLIPKTWSILKGNIWLNCCPEKVNIPAQGFKIHLSCLASETLKLLDTVLPILVENEVCFKIVRRQDFYLSLVSKESQRSSSAKYITIYPLHTEHFKALIELLYNATRDFKGPFVLTDKRYKDSSVVYYRYGGFLLQSTDSNHKGSPVIKDLQGNYVEDSRTPGQAIPHWIEDPFYKTPKTSAKDSIVLNERYKVESSLSYSSSGGVYNAYDLIEKRDVIIKESRPYIHFMGLKGNNLYAPQVLQNEYEILKDLSSETRTPKVYDFFRLWEHHYIVQEQMPGIPLTKHRAYPDMNLIPFKNLGQEKINTFQNKFTTIALQSIKIVQDCHSQNIAIGDVSPNNILISKDDVVSFIDFEGASRKDWIDREEYEKVPFLATPGYREFSAKITWSELLQSDWKSLSLSLESFFLPIQVLYTIDQSKKFKFLQSILADSGLSETYLDFFTSLWEGRPSEALKTLEQLQSTDSRPTVCASIDHHLCFEKTYQQLKETSKSYLVESPPLDVSALAEDRFSLAYGYYGSALMITKLSGQLPKVLEDCPTDLRELPSGLINGLAGMALAELTLGRNKKAEHYFSPLLSSTMKKTKEVSLSKGLAGQGFVALDLYKRTGQGKYLEYASMISTQLQETVHDTEKGAHWHQQLTPSSPIGVAHGATGVALFLLYLWKEKRCPNILQLALQAFDYDLAHNIGKADKLSYGQSVESKIALPYWEYGGAGLCSVALRFYRETQNERYLTLAKDLASSIFSRYAVFTGQFNGLCSIGEAFIDLYQTTHEEHYLTEAKEIAQRLTLFSCEHNGRLYFPGRGLMRLSLDYAFGTAGVALFLDRLTNGGPRLMHDLGVKYL